MHTQTQQSVNQSHMTSLHIHTYPDVSISQGTLMYVCRQMQLNKVCRMIQTYTKKQTNMLTLLYTPHQAFAESACVCQGILLCVPFPDPHHCLAWRTPPWSTGTLHSSLRTDTLCQTSTGCPQTGGWPLTTALFNPWPLTVSLGGQWQPAAMIVYRVHSLSTPLLYWNCRGSLQMAFGDILYWNIAST